MKNCYLSSILTMCGILFCCYASAESSLRDFGSTIPSEQDFIKALTPNATNTDVYETRRIRSLRAIKKVPSPIAPVRVNLSLTFEFDSAELTAQSKAVLDNLGTAINTGLSGYKFRIEGYTDAIGDAQYNQALSERRAQSVKFYLVTKYDIRPIKLDAIGKGELHLYNPDDISAPENRRVEIINVSSFGLGL